MWYDSFKLFIKKLAKTFDLQREILKTEMNHDEIHADNWRDKMMSGLIMLKMTFYVLLSVMLDIVKQWKNHWFWNERLFVTTRTILEIF